MGRGNFLLPLLSLARLLIDCVNISFRAHDEEWISLHALIFCLAISRFYFSHLQLLASWHELDETHQPSDTMGTSREIIIFIKGNLFFNRYFFIFLSRLRLHRFFFYMNQPAMRICVGDFRVLFRSEISTRKRLLIFSGNETNYQPTWL